MRRNYSPVQVSVFVNVQKELFAHVRLSTHTNPQVVVRIGKIGRSGVVTRQPFVARDEAREHAENVIARLTSSGYKQVA